MSILRNKLRKSVCPKRIRPEKNQTLIQDGTWFGLLFVDRMPAYITVFQFSPVMTWKIVTKDQRKVSKLARGMQSWR
jgi:hypothetical protein